MTKIRVVKVQKKTWKLDNDMYRNLSGCGDYDPIYWALYSNIVKSNLDKYRTGSKQIPAYVSWYLQDTL
jgi:hypothetical protein